MSKTSLGFIFSGLIYLVIGVTLGVIFLIVPETRALRPVHTHLNLVGFVVFLIFGIGYHILPRFRGNPLFSERLAWWQFWLANVGLVGLVIFMGIGVYTSFNGLVIMQVIFGSILVLSIYLFVYNMMKTLIIRKEG